MAQKKQGSKKRRIVKQNQAANSFDNLIGSYTEAIEENSYMIGVMLKELVEKSKEKPLTPFEKKTLDKIKRELNSIDKDLDSLGDY